MAATSRGCGVTNDDHIDAPLWTERRRQQQRHEGRALTAASTPAHTRASGMRAVADGAQAVECGGVLADGVAVRAPPTAAWSRSRPSWRPSDRASCQSARLRATARAAADRSRRRPGSCVCGLTGVSPRMAASTSSASARVGTRTSTHRPHLRRDDVGAEPAVDRPDVHADAPRRIVQREEPLDLMRHLQHGAGAFAGIQPGVGGAAVDGDRELADRFPCRFQPARSRRRPVRG